VVWKALAAEAGSWASKGILWGDFSGRKLAAAVDAIAS